MKIKNFALSTVLVLTAIVSTYFVTRSTAQQTPPVAVVNNDYQIGATLFMQTAAEYRALCLQAFKWGKRTLDDDEKAMKKLPKKERKMPRAVVVDIDETMLDNSPAQAFGIVNKRAFNDNDWLEWVNKRSAKAIPGAVDFAKYAKSRGVRVIYVSNRDQVHKQATIDNLIAVGFPDVAADNVMLREVVADGKKISSKDARRTEISKKYRIVMLMGDNLNDLATVFESKTVAERFAEVDQADALWGNRFIVLPNAMYGEWESAIYRTDKSPATPEEKRAKALQLP